MSTVRTMPATHYAYGRITAERDETSKHTVHRSGMKKLGFNEQQRAQLRAIKAEMKQCSTSSIV